MKRFRRHAVAAAALVMFLAGGARSQAQALKQVPADPLVVIKFNNPQALSTKVAALAKRLGVDKFNPEAAADPLKMLQQEMNLKEGFDATGEVAFALYAKDPKAAQNAEAESDDPRLVALLPISNYEQFLKNFQNVRSEGNLSTFTLPNDQDTMYAANWGKYAAFTDKRGMDLIKQKGTGIEVGGLSAKQLASNDAVLFANAKLLGSKVLPEFKTQRAGWIQEMENHLNDAPFDKKYIPVFKAAVNQMLNIAEQTLTDAQAATFGVTLNEKGLNTTVVAEFEPSSYIGKLWSSGKNSTESLVTGLPNRKYFAYGGMVIDPVNGPKLFDDIVGPIIKEAQKVGGPEMQAINSLAEGMKATFQATNTMAFGYAAPTAPPGQQSVMQQVFVYHGDSKKLQEAAAKSWEGMQSVMKLIPQAPGAQMNMQMKKGVKTVEGVTLDEMVMDMKLDVANNPEAAQMDQMMKMLYGPKGMGGYFGAPSDKTYIAVTGGNEELLTATIKSAKAGATELAQQAQLKAVAAALPQSRALVYYIDIGAVLNTGLQFAAQMGMAMPLKLPQDMPPIGISAGTEGSALRIDTHVSTELIENLVSAGMQAAMMMGGQQQRPGQL